MKRIILAAAAALAIAATPARAQANGPQHPDRETIAAADNYNDLLKDFEAGNKLTDAALATVYYGAALQPGFNADRDYAAVMAAYSSGDMKRAFTLAKEALASDPTNLSLLFKAYAAATASSDPDIKSQAAIYQTRLLGICDAIMNSGTGVTETSPYLVIRRSDINDYLVKYMQPSQILGQAQISGLTAIKAIFDGINDDVILYFGIFK